MDLKRAGNYLYLVGATRDELGASYLHLINNIAGGTVPQSVPEALRVMRALYSAIQADLVAACHDCSEGGLSVALAEMCIAGRLGAQVDVSAIAANSLTALFAESLCRFVVEVEPQNAASFERELQGIDQFRLGTVAGDRLAISHS